MRIVLSGVETNNKGAELMLYAILQEVERKWPDADVYIPKSRVKQGLSYINTSLSLHYLPFEQFVMRTHINSLLRRIGLPAIKCFRFVKADYFFDGSGFAFGDQWTLSNVTICEWENMLRLFHEKKCKVVFLPQAFGPVKKESTKKALAILNQYADMLMPRERVSYNYLLESGVVDEHKVRVFTDFTSLVEGEFPQEYGHLKDGICIIPNMKMIEKGMISFDNYIDLLTAIIMEGKMTGRPIYLLNHAGKDDAGLCNKCKESLSVDVTIVTGLNALQVKGLISSAYLVITSRFHGLASALNCCVPSLATSWSHKYSELFGDYGLDGYVLPLEDKQSSINLVRGLLDSNKNQEIRLHLSMQVAEIKNQTKEMWETIWKLR